MKFYLAFLRKLQMKARTITLIYDEMKRQQFEIRKYSLEQNMLNSTISGISDEQYCDHEIVVSLTTYGKRLHEVHLAVESIMEQTMKANRIVLWLSEELEGVPLPRALRMQQERGLEIRYCKDLRSYNKLVPSLREFPNDVIVTIDDDLVYETNLLENLVNSYQSDVSSIHCCRHHRMLLNEKKELLPYNSWQKEEPTVGCANMMNFPTGCGGILYPPHSLDEEVLNESIFLDICPYADDVWFKAMAMKNGTLSKKVYTHNPSGNDFLENDNVQDIGLKKKNVENECLNDKQIAAVFTRYDLYKLLQ